MHYRNGFTMLQLITNLYALYGFEYDNLVQVLRTADLYSGACGFFSSPGYNSRFGAETG